jgi:hypothetical protein
MQQSGRSAVAPMLATCRVARMAARSLGSVRQIAALEIESVARRGVNIYKLNGDLVGHLSDAKGAEKHLDKATDRLFQPPDLPISQALTGGFRMPFSAAKLYP